MTHTEIIETLRARLSMPGGRHHYGVLGSYRNLAAFGSQLAKAKSIDGSPLPKPVSVNRGILDTIPDDEFRKLVNDEAKRPEPIPRSTLAANMIVKVAAIPPRNSEPAHRRIDKDMAFLGPKISPSGLRKILEIP